MKMKNTEFANIFFLCEDDGSIIGIRRDPGKYQEDYYIGDVVEVTDDGCGYICPGIKTPGIGKITRVHKDGGDDHFFTVEMENGEIGYYIKSNRLRVIASSHR